MRLIIKILLFPIILLLTFFVSVCQFLYHFSTALLFIAAFLLFAFALGTMILLKDLPGGIGMMVCAYLISPYGILIFAS